jgi:hemolysin activation/secretion protein
MKIYQQLFINTISLILLLGANAKANAQLTPKPQPIPIPLPSPTPLNSPTPPTIPATPPSSPRVNVNKIEIIGSTVFKPQELQAVVQEFTGKSLTFEEIRQAADAVTKLYLNKGYITSRAVVVEQPVVDGLVKLQIIEGSLESIEIRGTKKINPDYVRSRIKLGAGTPVSQIELENHLRLLRLDPLFENVEANLRAGEGIGKSILAVQVVEANPVVGSIGIDNFSSPSVGSERFNLDFTHRNLTGNGDQLSASYSRTTTGGANVYDLSYRLPLNAKNGTIQFRVSPSSYEITDPKFKRFGIEGSANSYDISYRQPLERSPQRELALSLGFNYRDGQTLIQDIQIDDTTTSVFRFEQDYVIRDVRGAWGFRSQFNVGTAILGATSNRNPDGQFFSWLGQAQRAQILNQDNLLILQADLQLSPDGLPASHQFVIGGGQSLRGFRQNARIGDNGVRFSVEDQITLHRNEGGQPIVRVAPFLDLGTVWNAADNPVRSPNQNFLAGLGLGLLWQPLPKLNIRTDFAFPLVDLQDKGNNAQDSGLYFTVNYGF